LRREHAAEASELQLGVVEVAASVLVSGGDRRRSRSTIAVSNSRDDRLRERETRVCGQARRVLDLRSASVAELDRAAERVGGAEQESRECGARQIGIDRRVASSAPAFGDSESP
jgi:hypothetical protein